MSDQRSPRTDLGILRDPPRREVIKAKDGWHVVEWFTNGIHPDYRSVAGPFKTKAEATADGVEGEARSGQAVADASTDEAILRKMLDSEASGYHCLDDGEWAHPNYRARTLTLHLRELELTEREYRRLCELYDLSAIKEKDTSDA